MNYKLKQYRNAFTLAEVLITLMIAGIIAAITIPGLLQYWQDKDLKTKWKKIYAELAQADQQIRQDNGGDLSDYFDGVTSGKAWPLSEVYSNYLSYGVKCTMQNSTDWQNLLCPKKLIGMSSKYKTLDNNFLDSNNLGHGQIILNNGAHLFFRTWNSNASNIWVDVNGYDKAPNTLGKDMFGIVVTKNSFQLMGASSTGFGNCTNAYTSCGLGSAGPTACAGTGCSAQYLQE